MANKVTIDVEARFVDNVSGEAGAASSAFKKVETSAKAAAKEVDNLGKKTVSPKLDAETDKFKKAIDDSDKKLEKFGKSKAEVKLGAEDRATSTIDKVLSRVKNFGKKTWSAVLTAKDHATAGINKALNAAKRFAGKTYGAMVKIRDSEALASIRKITSGAEKFVGKTWTAAVKIKDMATAPLRGIKNMLFSIQSLVMAITAGLAAKQLIVNPINLADQYSSAKIGFSTLMGETAGQQMMDDLDVFAKKTPFKTSGVISAAQKMMAMGWDSENIIGDLEVLGNAAAATGNLDQGLESIVRAMSQIKTKGRLSTEELNQLAEAGISAKAMLAEQMGYGTGDEGIAKMTKDLEDGAIASNEAIAALMAGMQKYNGMMDSMANETVEGLWSQIQDTFEINVFRKWGQGLQDGAKKGFGTVIQLLEESEGALSEFGDMLYEIGKTASNWLADKFQNAVDRILKITDTFEFKNASLGEKLSMLWKGVIADPLKEWWEGGGQQKCAESAGKIGKWLGEMLTKGILALLGITDIFGPLEEGGKGEQAGMSIAQSFAKGFTESFDVSAITDKLVEAISNVWNALPTWAQILIGGYAAGKVMGGVGNFIGGVANFAGQVGSIIGTTGTVAAGGNVVGATGLLGLLGKTGQYGGVGSSGILGGLSKTGWALMGGTSAFSMTGGTAALIGGGSIAGGLAAGAGLIHAGKTGYEAYQGFKEGDKTKGWANVARSGSTLAGIGTGAVVGAKAGTAIGALFGGVGAVPGALIGSGIGALVGWLGGDAIAKRIEAAKYESEEMKAAIKDSDASAEELAQTFEKAKWEKAKESFGDIKLSMEEIARLSQQVVWGEDLAKYEKFSSATKQAEASLQALNSAGEQTDRWMWKAGLGVEFNEDEVESIKASFDDYINSAKSYVENKHYEFTASAELLLDLESEEGKAILESGNAYYAQVQEQLNSAGEELGQLLSDALADGIINADESKAIAEAQKKIAEITKKIADAEADAEMTMIELKFGGGNLDKESFDSFMQVTQENLNNRLSAADNALEAQIANLNLRFPTDEDKQTQEYKDQLAALIKSYNLEVESITADVLGVELNIIGEAFSGEDALGEDAVQDLQNILNHCIEEGITPAELELADIIELSGNPELSAENAGNIQDYLNGIFEQLDLSQFELVEVDGKVQLKLKSEVLPDEGTEEKVKETVDQQTPDTVNENVQVQITPEKLIQTVETITGEDFNLPETVTDEITLKLNAAKTVEEKINILAEEFGITGTEAASILWELTGEKDILNQITVTADDFGIPNSVSKTVKVGIRGVANYLTGEGGYPNGFRGGIFGGTGAMGSFARGGIAGKVAGNIRGFSDGGIVRGGSQLIEVAEEGSPEMVIPLSSQRRGRALKLWAQAGNMMGVPGFARGGIIGGDSSSDEGIRFHTAGGEGSSVSQSSEVNMGGITVQINVTAGSNGNIAEAIRAQANEITEVVAGIMADAISGQYENTPVRGGAA